ncbi:hypothetical protein F383_24709 [Gossypium arboreum]|uniref:Uncharacterized protein n=1 Tax=Gossypium arboreum TaxID=29729 RepID=A0A0B0NTT7_GOSAR|nr:hypothetical protein F383_22142 [Gossypium arboreum]KHG20631.1 hypothetical protein F383_24709 [Gossypium arboreum]
MDKSASLE